LKDLSVVSGPHLKHEELVSIADLAAKRLEIGFDGDAGRRKMVMIKWFEENWGVPEPLVLNIASSMNR
jgi:hypothetical protein